MVGQQAKKIEAALLAAADTSLRSKEDIITHVVEELEVPRPTVRRVKKALIEKLKAKIKVLE